MNRIKEIIINIPIIGTFILQVKLLMSKFDDSQNYWETRYATGGNSGCGSYGELAKFKADFLNNFVAEKKINSIIEFGCGDGNQLMFSNYQNYLGLDVAQTVIDKCTIFFANDPSKKFMLLSEYQKRKGDFKFELAISLDVIYHLVENVIYDDYMEYLFSASSRYVIIYSSNFDKPQTHHVKHRKFSDWVEKKRPFFKLIQFEKNKYPYKGNNETGSLADFYVYEKSEI